MKCYKRKAQKCDTNVLILTVRRFQQLCIPSTAFSQLDNDYTSGVSRICERGVLEACTKVRTCAECTCTCAECRLAWSHSVITKNGIACCMHLVLVDLVIDQCIYATAYHIKTHPISHIIGTLHYESTH